MSIQIKGKYIETIVSQPDLGKQGTCIAVFLKVTDDNPTVPAIYIHNNNTVIIDKDGNMLIEQ